MNAEKKLAGVRSTADMYLGFVRGKSGRTVAKFLRRMTRRAQRRYGKALCRMNE